MYQKRYNQGRTYKNCEKVVNSILKNISNKIYKLNYSVGDVIFVNIFTIEPVYRKRGYSKRILTSLQKKYDKPIVLLCFPTLLKFYKNIGFEEVCGTVDGYKEMIFM